MTLTLKRIVGLTFAVLFSLFLAESILRVGIAMRVASFRNPDLYADWATDDDYWKLRHLWGKNVMVHGRLYDPLLGWGTPITAQNPLGAITDKPYVIDSPNRAVLFLGDAFVEGVTRMDHRLPQLVGQALGTPVFNLGMSGYGVDQIFLKFQQARLNFQKPTAVIGLVSVDLDRSVQSFRTGPKPYFTLLNEKLVLKGVPVPPDPLQWLDVNPVQISSFLGAFVARKLRRFHSEDSMEQSYGRDEKEKINHVILKELVGECQEKQIPLFFVLFATKEEMAYEGWREKFLKAEVRRAGADYIDGKKILIHQARLQSKNPQDYFLSEGHLTADGNAIIANAVVKHLQSLGTPALN